MSVSTAYNADCLAAMRKMPDNAFDLAVVDPVYGDVKQGGYMKNVESCARLAHAIQYHTAVWDQEKTGKEYFDELFRVSKNQVIWGGNYFVEEIGRNSQCWLVWDKKHPDGVQFADVELAWTSFDRASRIFHFLWNGMLQENMRDKETRVHPTQKPVALYHWIFKNFAEPGMKILDTHLGSGSSRIAAFEAGLDFCGYEIDPTYYELQEARFQNYAAQLSLFRTEE